MDFIPKYKSKYNDKNDPKVEKDKYGFYSKYKSKPKVRTLTKSYITRVIKERSKKID